MPVRIRALMLMPCLILVLCGWTVRTAYAQRQFTDAELRARVLQAIEQGQQYLVSIQSRDGQWSSSALTSHSIGVHSLVLLAMINSGMTPTDPPVAQGLRWLRGQQIPDQTYDTSMMLMALAAAKDPRDFGMLTRLANRLQATQIVYGGSHGAWGYGEGGTWWDNSNTQFAILGLREAAHAGVVLDRRVLERSRSHWLDCQIGAVHAPRGSGWNYRGQAGGNVSGSMTVAGIACLSVLEELLQDDRLDTREGQILCCLDLEPTAGELSIDSGKRWLSSHFTVNSNPGDGRWLLYYLYGLERAGRFTGTRFFGPSNDPSRDWYRAGADFLVRGQNFRNGSWSGASENDPTIGTSLALLFLSKGLAPVMINKIQYGRRDPRTREFVEHHWNVHPRDVANLTEHVSTLDRWPNVLNWQTVDLETAASHPEGLAELLQAPVLYLSGDEDLSIISQREVDLLREAISQGGFLFAVQNCNSARFDQGFRDLVTRMFPDGEYRLQRLPETHDIYRSEHVFAVDPPELWGVDFGCRTAIVYAPYDHACRWSKWLRVDPPNRHPDVTTSVIRSLRLAVNVLAYATGRELHDRLETPDILGRLDENHIAQGRLSIARLRHTGGFDAAPNAHRHLLIALQATLGLEPSNEAPTVSATDPKLFDYPILYMHGRKNFQLTVEELEKLRDYLQNGGVIIADACCGSIQFDDSFRKMVDALLQEPLIPIPITHEIFNHPVGHDIRRVQRRIPSDAPGAALTVEESVGEPILEGVELNGRYAVLYSKYDLSCALERQATVACAGYLSEDAARIAVNLVVYALFQ